MVSLVKRLDEVVIRRKLNLTLQQSNLVQE